MDIEERYLWNHCLHENWGKEKLYFISLSFSPTYDGQKILLNIKKVFLDYSVLSYAIYELTGNHDILLRVWLPTSKNSKNFIDELFTLLKEHDVNFCDIFHVSEIVSHWVWDNGGKDAMREPAQDIIRNKLSDDQIRKINEEKITAEEYELYKKQDIISACNPGSGIKVMVFLPPYGVHPTDAYKALVSQIKETFHSSEYLSEVSIYAGEGRFAQILAMARVIPEKFDIALSNLIRDLNKCGLKPYFKIRTYTYIALNCSNTCLKFEDRLPIGEDHFNSTFTPQKLLTGEETKHLEVKGSLAVDLKNYYFGKGNIEMSDRIVNEGALKAIVGLLNAEGGAVIIGALEKNKYEKCKMHMDKLKELPEYCDYILCGIELDYGNNGWDGFQLKLQDLLESRIEPSPSIWLTVKKEALFGKDLCLININPPNQDWFYLKDKNQKIFYVREGNRTIDYSGSKADQYKKAYPRNFDNE